MKISIMLLGLALAGCSINANVGKPKAPASTSSEPDRAEAPASGRITIPDLVWMNDAEARAALAAAGHTGSVTVSDALCPPEMDGRLVELGVVCYQHPPAGRQQGARLPIQIKVQTRQP